MSNYSDNDKMYINAMEYVNGFNKFIDNENNKFIYVLSIYDDYDQDGLCGGDVILGHFIRYEDAYMTAVNNLNEVFAITKENLIDSAIDLDTFKRCHAIICYDENHEIAGAEFE